MADPMIKQHPAQSMPAPKGYMCAAGCGHGIVVHREFGCDVTTCDCPAPFGRIMPADGPPTWRAVELAEGSVVADDRTVFIARVDPKAGDYPRWEGNLNIEATDAQIDAALANGAQVLRVGTGTEG